MNRSEQLAITRRIRRRNSSSSPGAHSAWAVCRFCSPLPARVGVEIIAAPLQKTLQQCAKRLLLHGQIRLKRSWPAFSRTAVCRTNCRRSLPSQIWRRRALRALKRSRSSCLDYVARQATIDRYSLTCATLGLLTFRSALDKLFHQLHLDLLNLHQPLPLMRQQQVDLGVDVADFQLGL